MSGLFITLEGGEGSGKSTQCKKLHEALLKAGKKVTLTREPGGTPATDAIRTLLLTGNADKWHPVAETLLFQAARVEHVERVIAPALARGEIVLCDRFLDSTMVYQGIAKGLGIAYVRELHRLTLGALTPNLTLLLDIPPAEGLARAGKRTHAETRFEGMGAAFHENVRAGFLALAKAEPQRFQVIDASASQEAVHAEIMSAVKSRLSSAPSP